MTLTLDHIVLNVNDINQALRFYLDILGLRPERVDEFRRGEAPFPSVRINPHCVIDLFPGESTESGQNASEVPGRQNLNHFCLALEREDWLALKMRLEENEITILEGPVSRWGAQGKGISIYFRDCDENQIEARYYETETAD